VSLALQIVWLFVLAIPIACIAWTITHEEIFHEPRDYCKRRSQSGNFTRRKFFYVFTCEYCLSHYVALFILLITGYKLLLPGWRGYLIGFFALVWVANQYMSVYARLRLDIQHERIEIKTEEKEMNRPQKAA
jgi:hypothetical protein